MLVNRLLVREKAAFRLAWIVNTAAHISLQVNWLLETLVRLKELKALSGELLLVLVILPIPNNQILNELLERNITELVPNDFVNGCLASDPWEGAFDVTKVNELPDFVILHLVHEGNPPLFCLKAVETVGEDGLFKSDAFQIDIDEGEYYFE